VRRAAALALLLAACEPPPAATPPAGAAAQTPPDAAREAQEQRRIAFALEAEQNTAGAPPAPLDAGARPAEAWAADLAAPDVPTRRQAVHALAALGEAARPALPALERAAAEDDDFVVRREAAAIVTALSGP